MASNACHPNPHSVCLLGSMCCLGVEFYTWTVFLDTKTVTKTSSDDEGQVSLLASYPLEKTSMQWKTKYTGVSSNKFRNSSLPGGFLCYPKLVHHQVLTNHRVRHRWAACQLFFRSHLKCKSVIKVTGEGDS